MALNVEGIPMPIKGIPMPIGGIPIGTILAYGGIISGEDQGRLDQLGWLLCNGAEVSREDWEELFKIIGDSFGAGDLASTFNLPDLRGMFLRGVDAGAGKDPDAKSRTSPLPKSGATGDNVGSIQDDTLMSHTHQVVSWGDTGAESDKTAASDAAFSNRAFTRGDGSVSTSTETHAVLPNNGKSETRPKNIYVNYIIKAKDV